MIGGLPRMSDEIEYPEEGEFVVVNVQEIEKNGAYLSLQGYSDDIRAFVFIEKLQDGLLALRSFARRARTVARVTRVRKDKRSVDVSISLFPTSVGAKHSKIGRMNRGLVSYFGSSPSVWVGLRKSESMSIQLSDTFGGLYAAFAAAAATPESLADFGFEGDWIPMLLRLH